MRSPTLLQDWARHTDFPRLQHLVLGSSNDGYPSGLTGETMAWLSQAQLFSQLRALRVYLTRDDMYIERPDYSANAVSFFQTLKSLEELSVTGPMDSSMVDAIVSRHGQTLLKLSLHTFEMTYHNYVGARIALEIPGEFTRGRLLQIQAGCPALEYPAVPVKRKKFIASETELFRTFARIENLKTLSHTLDCSNWHVGHDRTYDPQFDEDDEKLVDLMYLTCKEGPYGRPISTA